MIFPARNIWETRIHALCSVIAAHEAGDDDLWLCTSFAHEQLDPPRIIVNPNRLYPIEGMIRRTGRFSLNVMAVDERDRVRRLTRVRRREVRKAEAVGWQLDYGDLGLPYLTQAMRTLFCEVEEMLDTGDHTVTIARVNSLKVNPETSRLAPLLYPDVSGEQPSKWQEPVQKILRATGASLFARTVLQKVSPPKPADLPRETYESGGQTDPEVQHVLSYGAFDHGRVLEPPAVLSAPKDPISVCVIGTHWGLTHVQALRKASPNVQIFVCGRDEDRTSRVAAAWKADGYFVGIQRAVEHRSVDAITLAMPHHMHRQAAELALIAGKHVLVEKPIANTPGDAESMIETARRCRRVLMVAENMHYRPALREAFYRLRAGDLGEPLTMMAQSAALRQMHGWGSLRAKSGGGVFLDQAIHYVRAMRILLGEPDEVNAFPWMQIQTKMEGEDGLTAIFSSDYGWQSQISATCSATLGKFPDLVLVGDRGTLQLWPKTGIIDYYPLAPRPITKLLSYVRPYSLQAKLMHPRLQRVRTRIGREDTGYTEEMSSFLNLVSRGRTDVESATEGMRDLEIVLCAYRSVELRRPIKIPDLLFPVAQRSA